MKLRQKKIQVLSFSLVVVLIFMTIMPVLAFDAGVKKDTTLLENNEIILENNNIEIENEADEESTSNVVEKEIENKADEKSTSNVVEKGVENKVDEEATENMYNLQPMITTGTIEIAPMAVSILPTGSTSNDLQTAINNATSGDTITISSDMQFLGIVTIPTGKAITIESDTGNNWAMNQTIASRHFMVKGQLTLQNIIIDGNSVGGGIYVDGNATLNIYDGTIIQNNSNSGVYLYYDAVCNMYGGKITKNITTSLGAGVSSEQRAIFNMYSGSIDGNTTSGYGGGIDSYGIVNIYSGTISGNTSSRRRRDSYCWRYSYY